MACANNIHLETVRLLNRRRNILRLGTRRYREWHEQRIGAGCIAFKIKMLQDEAVEILDKSGIGYRAFEQRVLRLYKAQRSCCEIISMSIE